MSTSQSIASRRNGNGHAAEGPRFLYLDDRLAGIREVAAGAAPRFEFLEDRLRRERAADGNGHRSGNGHHARGELHRNGSGHAAPKAVAQAKPAPRPGGPSDRTATPALRSVAAETTALLDQVGGVIVGKRDVLELVAVCVLAGGNILFEDYPGLAKTLLANTFARASGCSFRRIQFTPDTFPADITGSSMLDQRTGEFQFRPGPVFGNVLLADEINRAPPKTQAALLEAMQERQVTVDGATHRLPRPFLVMATQNPVEQEGTYPLPEAQMDRFLMKLSMGYPSRADEAEILHRRIARASDEVEVRAVTDAERIVAMQHDVEKVRVDRSMVDYIADVVARTREHEAVHVGSSPRGSQGLLKAARARAAMRGRGFVAPDDVRAMAPHVLAHRLTMRPEARLRGVDARKVMADVLRAAPVPTV